MLSMLLNGCVRGLAAGVLLALLGTARSMAGQDCGGGGAHEDTTHAAALLLL